MREKWVGEDNQENWKYGFEDQEKIPARGRDMGAEAVEVLRPPSPTHILGRERRQDKHECLCFPRQRRKIQGQILRESWQKERSKRGWYKSISVGSCLNELHFESFYKQIVHRKGWKRSFSWKPWTVKHPKLYRILHDCIYWKHVGFLINNLVIIIIILINNNNQPCQLMPGS